MGKAHVTFMGCEVQTGSGERIPTQNSCRQRIIALLEQLPPGKLVTTRVLAEELGRSLDHVRHVIADPELDPYRLQSGNRFLWGPAALIKKLCKAKSTRPS